MAQEAGFKIGTDFYPVPDHFTLGDAVLVEQVAELSFEEFALQMDGDTDMSAKALIALIAVSVQHAKPRWDRGRVASYVAAVDWAQFENIEGDERPPARRKAKSSDEPSDESTPPPEPKVEAQG